MKIEKYGYIITFLGGILLGNILDKNGMIHCDMINRDNLRLLQFSEMTEEAFLVQIIFMRFQVVLMLWVICKMIPMQWVAVGFASIVCLMMGLVISTSILANGIWGSWFVFCALMPHGGLYFAAFELWQRTCKKYKGFGKKRTDDYYRNAKVTYYWSGNDRRAYVCRMALICLLMVTGCLAEAYIGPAILKNVIKY